MSDPDDLVPREEVAERIESLADRPELAEQYPLDSEGETAYVHGVDDAAEVVKDWPDDDEASDE